MSVLSALREAIEVTADMGLVAVAAREEPVLRQAEQRIGFEGSAFVLALAGGTGVGKSSLLNALAGSKVSEVGVLRPTTARPLAWVAAAHRETVRPLLEWLAIEQVVTHDRRDLADVVILDLPDFDSIELEHKATVDRLLPRLDALLWVVDQEKYDDLALHVYLRQLVPHSARLAFVVNKSDRLEPAEQKTIADDFRRRLEQAGYRSPSVFMVSAHTGEGLSELLASLARQGQTKRIVAEKVDADARQSLRRLGEAAAISPHFEPLIDERERAKALGEAVAGALAVVDLDRLAEQVRAATLYRARRQGGSLLARILALLSNLTGGRKRSADPFGFLLAWRQRGSLGHIVNPVRRAILQALARLPGASRPELVHKLDLDHLEPRLTRAMETAVAASRATLEPRGSLLWLLVGAFQLLLGAAFLFAVAWYLALIFGPATLPVGTYDIPYLGAVPAPLVLLVGSLGASLLLGLLLNLHAGWLGRKKGRQVATLVQAAIEETLVMGAFGPLDRIEAARERLRQLVNP